MADPTAPSPDAPAPEAGEPPALLLRERALGAFADPLRVRDPSGRGRRPNLTGAMVQTPAGPEPGLRARGPFNLQQRYAVSKAQGTAFCSVTGDTNPIHWEGNVVPGALTAAKLLLGIEVLFPQQELRRFAMKFTSIATYGSPLLTRVRCEPRPGGGHFTAVIAEEGVTVAELEVDTARREQPLAPVPRRRVDVGQVRAVCTFARVLGLTPWTLFPRPRSLTRREAGLYYYPRSFLAALPSGEMVRQLRGEGGVLNKLTLEFDPGVHVPIFPDAAPAVDLERGYRKSAFNKVLAAIRHGVGTVVRGTALVFSGEHPRAAPRPAAEGGSPPSPEA